MSDTHRTESGTSLWARSWHWLARVGEAMDAREPEQLADRVSELEREVAALHERLNARSSLVAPEGRP